MHNSVPVWWRGNPLLFLERMSCRLTGLKGPCKELLLICIPGPYNRQGFHNFQGTAFQK